MDPMLNLLVRIFDGMERGVWVRILPNDDTINDLCTASYQKWEDLLPLLIKTGLINCKVAEDVKSYEYRKNSWESLITRTADTLDLRTTRKWQKGQPSFWVMCLGDPKYNNPTDQWKAMASGAYSFVEYQMSPKQVQLRRELRAAAKEILFENATSRLKESQAKGNENTKEARDCADASKFEAAIDFALEGLDLERKPRKDRHSSDKVITVHNRKQANERERMIVLHTAYLWGWKDGSLTKRERVRIVCTGGHGTKEAWEKFTNDLATKHKVKIIRQCPRSPETNVLDLGIWLSIQAAVEKKMHMRRGDKEALAMAVLDAWENGLSSKSFTKVCDRLQNVLALIVEDKGGNALVEEKRGKEFRGLDMPEESN